MKKIMGDFLYFVACFLVSLRYRIKVKGLEKIRERGGILFLANHPAEIDPVILERVLWKKFRPHPVALDSLFQNGLRFFLEHAGALPIPSFEVSTNSFKTKQIDKIYSQIFSVLREKENILIYPAGGLKISGEERIGGTSGVHKIIQSCPEATVVLIRTVGLWGSSFSKAQTGKRPELKKVFLRGAKILLKNFIFFAPKRTIEITFDYPPKDFPLKGSKLELNRALEKWYNQNGPEPLNLVSYAFWKKELPQVHLRTEKEKETYDNIPEEVKTQVTQEIARLSMKNPAEIKLTDDLAIDLGLDSLDKGQLVVFLKETFGIQGPHPSDMTLVGEVMAIASGKIKVEEEEEEEEKPLEKWHAEVGRADPQLPVGETILEAFLNTSHRLNDYLACSDQSSGELTYQRMRQAVILMALSIQKLPGEKIGIMLPASVGVNILILATQLAGKVPVMINWTLGPRNLRAILETSKIQKTISSWKFLDRLENFDLDGVDEDILLIDKMRREFSSLDKARTLMLAKYSPQKLMQAFNVSKMKAEDPAVILYTSGTESLPKGVPLSHKNILSNQRDAFNTVNFRKDDVILGVLPSFHSFGFSVTGLFPLLAGMKVAYIPNPTDGRRMAFAIDKWKVSVLCIAPTFLKNLIRVAKPEQLSSLKMIVAGAEKMSPDIYQKLATLCPHSNIMEGYGITECAPILTINPAVGKKKGVGKPLPSVSLAIVHPETYLPATEGLILAHGPNVFKGYLNPEIDSPFIEMNGKKWYKTGDLGMLDEEGYLTLSGRMKRFTKIGPEMISLGAIEEILQMAAEKQGWKVDPLLPSLAVVADEGEGKKTEIVLFTSFPLSLEEANAEIKKSGMSNLVRLSKVTRLPLIPLLGTGKIDYRSLKTTL